MKYCEVYEALLSARSSAFASVHDMLFLCDAGFVKVLGKEEYDAYMSASCTHKVLSDSARGVRDSFGPVSQAESMIRAAQQSFFHWFFSRRSSLLAEQAKFERISRELSGLRGVVQHLEEYAGRVKAPYLEDILEEDRIADGKFPPPCTSIEGLYYFATKKSGFAVDALSSFGLSSSGDEFDIDFYRVMEYCRGYSPACPEVQKKFAPMLGLIVKQFSAPVIEGSFNGVKDFIAKFVFRECAEALVNALGAEKVWHTTGYETEQEETAVGGEYELSGGGSSNVYTARDTEIYTVGYDIKTFSSPVAEGARAALLKIKECWPENAGAIEQAVAEYDSVQKPVSRVAEDRHFDGRGVSVGGRQSCA